MIYKLLKDICTKCYKHFQVIVVLCEVSHCQLNQLTKIMFFNAVQFDGNERKMK